MTDNMLFVIYIGLRVMYKQSCEHTAQLVFLYTNLEP